MATPAIHHIRPFDGSGSSSFIFEESGTQHVTVDASGSMLTITGDNRLYLVERPARDGLGWLMQRYERLSLLGKQLTFSMDVSGVGCSCNAAVYLVREPPRLWWRLDTLIRLRALRYNDDQLTEAYLLQRRAGGRGCAFTYLPFLALAGSLRAP
jgi:hypothetical protein